MTGKRRKAGSPAGSSKTKVSKSRALVLGSLAASESAEVLETLLGRHPDLRREAEQIARDLLADLEPESIAASVAESVLTCDLGDLGARAGRQVYGYVDETDEAWEILEEAMQPFQDDLQRYIDLDMQDKAVLLCSAIVSGLYEIGSGPEDAVLGYAPDFPMATAGETVAFLARESRKKYRRPWLLPRDALSRWPDWREMLDRASRRR